MMAAPTGLRHMVRAVSARMGTRMLPVAVLLQRLVMITVSPVNRRLATQAGRDERFSLREVIEIM